MFDSGSEFSLGFNGAGMGNGLFLWIGSLAYVAFLVSTHCYSLLGIALVCFWAMWPLILDVAASQIDLCRGVETLSLRMHCDVMKNNTRTLIDDVMKKQHVTIIDGCLTPKIKFV